jgi:hypothetical protein
MSLIINVIFLSFKDLFRQYFILTKSFFSLYLMTLTSALDCCYITELRCKNSFVFLNIICVTAVYAVELF